MVAGLELHHIGIAVRDLPAAADRYQARFGYEHQSGVIHDPAQQAYVQFFKLPGDRVYLELVSPAGPASRLDAAVQKGESLHHLCYSTTNIEGACADLRRKGMTLVRAPVPAAAFPGRRIAWLMGRDRILTELVEKGPAGEI